MKVVSKRKFERIHLICTEKEIHSDEVSKFLDKYMPTDNKPVHALTLAMYGIRDLRKDEKGKDFEKSLEIIPGYREIIAERLCR